MQDLITESWEERLDNLWKLETLTYEGLKSIIRQELKSACEKRDAEIIRAIAEYSGINDIQTKELIKIIKAL
jgi:hypothetical protein